MSMIGLGSGIADVAEFNRRAAIALRGVDVPDRSTFDQGFVRSISQRIDRGLTLSNDQQLPLYRVIDRYRSQITDRALIDFAAERTKQSI